MFIDDLFEFIKAARKEAGEEIIFKLSWNDFYKDKNQIAIGNDSPQITLSIELMGRNRGKKYSIIIDELYKNSNLNAADFGVLVGREITSTT